MSIDAGQYLTVSDTISWDIVIPDCAEPNNWWSVWGWGEVGVEVAPIPEPATMGLLAVGGLLLLRRRRRS